MGVLHVGGLILTTTTLLMDLKTGTRFRDKGRCYNTSLANLGLDCGNDRSLGFNIRTGTNCFMRSS